MAYVKRNQEHNGIEIYFDSKPSNLILSSIKGAGWRWSSYKRCWYNYYSNSNYAFANSICNEVNKTSKVKNHDEKQEKLGKSDNSTETRKTNKTEKQENSVDLEWLKFLSNIKVEVTTTLSPEEEVAKKYNIHVNDKVTFVLSNGIQAFGVIKKIVSESEIHVDYSYYSNGNKINGIDVFYADELKKDIGYERYKYENLSVDKREDIDYNERVKNRIKGRIESFSEAYTTQQNNVLFKHQKAGCLLAEKYDRFAFFYDTGTGKTVMALDIINAKYEEDETRFLIIAPKAIIQTAWMDDAKKYYPEMRILPLIKSFKSRKRKQLLEQWKGYDHPEEENQEEVRNDKYLDFLMYLTDCEDLYKIPKKEIVDDRTIEDMVQHYIINPELFIRDPEKIVAELNISGIVVDESAIMKNYNSRTTQEIIKVCEKMKYVYLLSGKPAPNNELEYFSQMKVVDPDTFNMSYSRFSNDFGVGDYQKEVWLSDNAKDTLSKLISARSLIISKDDCLDLPPTLEVVHQFELPSDIMDEYDRLYEDCLAVIKGMDNSQRVYSATSKLAVLMKLRQMASGFFIVNDDDGNKNEKEIVPIHENKIEELNNILDEIGDEQVIVWCQFQYEIKRIEDSLSRRGTVVTAYGGTKDVNKSISDFKEGRAKFIIAHPKTLKYGVTFTNCRYAIYYSFSYSAEDYDQSHDRIYRLGQTEKCTFFFLQAENTIDELMYQKVMKKLSNAEFFEWLIKDASNHGIDYERLKEREDDDLRGVSDELIKEITSNEEPKITHEKEVVEDLDPRSLGEREIDALIELPICKYDDLDKLHRIIDSMLDYSLGDSVLALKYRFNFDSHKRGLRTWDEVGRMLGGWRTSGQTAQYYANKAKSELYYKYESMLFYLTDVYLNCLDREVPLEAINQISSLLYDYYLDFATSLEDSYKEDEEDFYEYIVDEE
ncbi:MAG: DEAD/DEAH box helicase [Lachnospiraceae bacterium]|nr:DEAD/DEAH box helicase [Lachnospiraceae bacterium]